MERNIAWVEANLPTLTMKGPEAVRKVVAEAEKSAKPLQWVLSFATAFVPVSTGDSVARWIFGPAYSSLEWIAPAVTLGVIIGLGFGWVYVSYVRRKIVYLSEHGSEPI